MYIYIERERKIHVGLHADAGAAARDLIRDKDLYTTTSNCTVSN